MDKTPFDDEIDRLETRIGTAETELVILKRKRAEYLCPYKLGQILVSKKGQRAEVTAIFPGWSWSVGYELKGRYILKNGKPGLVIHKLYEWDDWKPE